MPQQDTAISPFIWSNVTRYVRAGDNVTWRGPRAALDRPLAPFYDLGEGTVASVFLNGVLLRWGHEVFAGERPELGELRFARELNPRIRPHSRWRTAARAIWMEACERRPLMWLRMVYVLFALPRLPRMARRMCGPRDVIAVCPTPY